MSAAGLSTGTRVTLCGLQARPELNGKSGRVLVKKDATSGRCGVRLDGEAGEAQTKPLAIKPANLQPLPFGAGSRDGLVHELLDLPTELLECVMGHLSARALLRTSAACALLCAVRAAGDGAVWEGVLSHPWVDPYRQTSSGRLVPALGDGEVPCGELAFLAAAQRRKAWLESDRQQQQRDASEGPGRSLLPLSFERFVRSVAVDYDSLTIAVGLSSGAVACTRVTAGKYDLMQVRHLPEMPSLHGEAHEEQVVALALHAPSGLVISGCGTPSYPVAYEPGPYRATVKLWKLTPPPEEHPAAGAVGVNRERDRLDRDRERFRLGLLPALGLDGELTHTLERHTGAVRKLLVLDAPARGNAPPTHVASGSDDGTVVVWSVREGGHVRTLTACQGPPERSGVVGLALLPGPVGGHKGEGEALLLSADEGFCVHVWDWRAGTLLRTLRGFNNVEGFYHGVATQHDALSAIALHAPSGVLALGSVDGAVALFTLLLHRREPPFWAPLVVGSAHHHGCDRRVNRDDRSDVVSLQLDDDKLVSVGRSGKLRVSRLRLERNFGHPANRLPTKLEAASNLESMRLGAVLGEQDCTDLAPGDPTDLMRCVRQHDAVAPKFAEEFRRDDDCFAPEQLGDMLYAQTKTQLGANLGLFAAWDRGVRYYVSSVSYGGGVLVHDGLDDKILVSFCGAP